MNLAYHAFTNITLANQIAQGIFTRLGGVALGVLTTGALSWSVINAIYKLVNGGRG